jgi:deoxyribodipyrimidine photolyase-related protein
MRQGTTHLRASAASGGCSFDHAQRVGEDACPFTTPYWDFVLRHADRFVGDHRTVRPVRAAERLFEERRL